MTGLDRYSLTASSIIFLNLLDCVCCFSLVSDFTLSYFSRLKELTTAVYIEEQVIYANLE